MDYLCECGHDFRDHDIQGCVICRCFRFVDNDLYEEES